MLLHARRQAARHPPGPATRDARRPRRVRAARQRQGGDPVLDPQSDTLLRQKAERLQIQPQRVESVETSELKVQEIWQGARLRYGASKQEVLPVLPFAPSTFQYEATLTPRIKDLILKDKPKVKVLAPAAQSRQGPPKTYNLFREWVKTRFEVSDLDLSEGKLVPPDTKIVLVFRPKDLTDRNKYALDQFLMGGGRLVVFADTDDVEIGNADNRSYWAQPVEADAKDAKLKFVDQLANYGAKVEDRLVADLATGVHEFFGRVQQTMQGQGLQPVAYPYFFHAVADWGNDAAVNQLALNRQTGQVDAEKAAQYKAAFKPGMAKEHPLTLKQANGPGFFWPCPVALVETLPAGVTGETILRTSPATLVERAPREMNPFGRTPDNPRELMMALQKFNNDITSRAASEPRRQIGMMVALQGTFPSFFAGKAIPPRKPPQPVVDTSDPLTEKVGKDGDKSNETEKPDDTIGPKPPEGTTPTEDKDADPTPIEVAPVTAQLVVLGDSDFLRDDYVGGTYAQVGKAMTMGPVSVSQQDYRTPLFFVALLDWLVQDTDLVALRSKVGADRSLKLAAQDTLGAESLEAFTQRVNRKTAWLQWVNILGPGAFLLVLWVVVAVQRRARKLAFLRSAGN
ncbi:MAG: GldG family protein [Phycisphaerales bacterium]|nr:GldG family protein [Phycisphaerales bacterium]